jgi:hypothetical protein
MFSGLVLFVLLFIQTQTEDDAESIAREAMARDITAAQKHVNRCEESLKKSMQAKDREATKRARADLKRSKESLAKVKSRKLEDYMDAARKSAEERLRKAETESRRQEAAAIAEKRRAERMAELRKIGPVVVQSAVVVTNAIGLPELNFGVMNPGDVPVEAFDMHVECYNSFDEPVVGISGTNTTTIAVSDRLHPGGEKFGSVQLSLHRTTSKAKVRVSRVKLINGEVWSQTRDEADAVPGAVFSAGPPR